MTLKMKLTASISAFLLVLGLMLTGIFAANKVTINMGGSVTFNATDVYARITGNVSNDMSKPENLDVTYSADETPQGDDTVWNNLNLVFDSVGTPIEIAITVENLSSTNTLRVNLDDKVTSSVANFNKAVTVDGQTYANLTDITLQTNGSEDDSITFVITLSVEEKNNTIVADLNFQINLYDQNYVEPKVYDYLEFEIDEENKTATITKCNEDAVTPTNNELKKFMVSDFYSTSEMTFNTLYFGTWNYTDINGEKGTLTFDNIMDGLDPSTIATPIDVEVDYTVTIPNSSYMEWLNMYMQTFEQLKVSGNITGGFYAKAGDNENAHYDSVDKFDEYLSSNYQTEESLSKAFPMILNLEKPIIEYLKIVEIPNSISKREDGIFIDGDDYTVTSIGDRAFASSGNITNVTIPDGIISIGAYAFSRCLGLTSVTIPASVKSIGSASFDHCDNLQNVTFSEGSKLETLQPYTFRYCTSLRSVIFEEGAYLSSIGDSAFTNCINLFYIEFPTNLKIIDRFAFYLSGLRDDVFESMMNLESVIIGSHSFASCRNLENVKIPANVESIGSGAFDSCSGIKTIDLINCTSLTLVGSYAFENCSSLTSVDFSGCGNLTSIGDYAFSSCSSLTSVDFSGCGNLTSIGSYAFENCSSLTSVDFSGCGNLTSIGHKAFRNCSSLTSVDFSGCGNLISIGSYAFENCGNLTSVEFPATTGWYVTTLSGETNGEDIDVTNSEQNAIWLKSTYYNYYFER